MELTDLMTFSTVARLGGITRAADELHTVQSNVTQRIKALEAEIGTAYPDLTDLAARQLVASGVHDVDLRARTGQADAVDMISRQLAGHDGGRRRGLGR